MKRLIAKWLGIALCEHKWSIMETGVVTRDNGAQVAKVYVQKCDKCGALHNHRAGVFS